MKTTGIAGGLHFRAKNLRTTDSLADLTPGEHAVIIWNGSKVTEAQKRRTASLLDFAAAGGRVVVLGMRQWHWSEL